jgi:hypothetical protein
VVYNEPVGLDVRTLISRRHGSTLARCGRISKRLEVNVKPLFLIFLFLSLSFHTSMAVVAQDFPSFVAKAKSIVEAKDSRLKVVARDEKEKEHFYIWNSGLEQKVPGIRLRIFYGASAKEATERMKSALDNLSVGPGPALKGLGDEAYISRGVGVTSVRFRQSNVYVDVAAPSEEIARDIAKKLSDLISGK